MISLNENEQRYYSRQMRLSSVGEQGQICLKRASVLLVGLGGLGSPISLYLTSAGIGRLGIVEYDVIDETNLHRQVLYSFSQVNEKKLNAGVERLRALNPHIQIEAHVTDFNCENARDLVRGYDLVIDASDNFDTRYLLNDACILEKKPFISAAILGFEGQLSVYNYEEGPCYRCLYPKPPAIKSTLNCDEWGVLGVLPGVMGTLQANEALKIFLKLGEVASGRLICFDAISSRFQEYKFKKNLNCDACGPGAKLRISSAPSQAVVEVAAQDLRSLINSNKNLTIVDVRDLSERKRSCIEGSIHVLLADVLSGQFNISKEQEVVFYCEYGARSLKAAQYFSAQGFERVRSLKGGIKTYFSTG